MRLHSFLLRLSKPIYIYSTTGYDLFSLITPPRRYYFVKRLYISFFDLDC